MVDEQIQLETILDRIGSIESSFAFLCQTQQITFKKVRKGDKITKQLTKSINNIDKEIKGYTVDWYKAYEDNYQVIVKLDDEDLISRSYVYSE